MSEYLSGADAVFQLAAEFCRDFELTNNLDRNTLLNKAVDFLKEEVRETEEAIVANDRAEIIDGFGDVAFIAINGILKEFVSAGDTFEVAQGKVVNVLYRICKANNNKRQADGSVLRVNNKVQKPEGWKEPTYEDLL